MPTHSSSSFFFFFNDTATTEIYTLSLHDALPIYRYSDHQRRQDCQDLPPRKLAQCLGAAARQVTASRRGSARQGLIPPDPHEAFPVLHADLEMLVNVGGAGSARLTSMRRSWRAVVSDSPRPSLWGALKRRCGITSSRRNPSSYQPDVSRLLGEVGMRYNSHRLGRRPTGRFGPVHDRPVLRCPSRPPR